MTKLCLLLMVECQGYPGDTCLEDMMESWREVEAWQHVQGWSSWRKPKRRLLVKVQPSCSGYCNILGIPVEWDGYQGQRQVWHWVILSLWDNLHVLWMSELETWSRTGPLETRRYQVPEGLTLNFTLLNLGFAFLWLWLYPSYSLLG